MDKFILDQLMNQSGLSPAIQKIEPTEADVPYSRLIKTDNKKLSRPERLIFLRVFKALSKKFKRDNQIELALKLKAIFKEADKLKVFEYFDGFEYKLNADKDIYEYVALPKEEVKRRSRLAEDFLKKIGLNDYLLYIYFDGFYKYSCYILKNISVYFYDATPAAIVQMNKRLKKLKSKDKLT